MQDSKRKYPGKENQHGIPLGRLGIMSQREFDILLCWYREWLLSENTKKKNLTKKPWDFIRSVVSLKEKCTEVNNPEKVL